MEKAIVLLSTGIDSPVASHLMKNKLELIFLHFSTSNNNKKIETLKNKINKDSKLIIIDQTIPLQEIKKHTNPKYTCILCKRMMYRIAEALAKKHKAKYILTGESLGQVASQTLDNLTVLDQATKLTVLRPLLAYDKEEAITIAKKIGTFDISIQDQHTCPFLPKNPATKSELKKIEAEENKLDIKEIIKKLI